MGDGIEPVTSWKQDSQGVTIRLNSGTLRILLCSDTIFRIQYAKEGPIIPLPDIIQAKKWEPIRFTVTEDSSKLVIKTKLVTAFVRKVDGVLSFADAAGRVFLSEPTSGGRIMNAKDPKGSGSKRPWSLQQTFTAADDEYLYGMGQYQEGVWNWRGMPLELRQQNTQVVIPLLLSSRGYGLLWNNASWSFLNPCDEEVPLSRLATNFSAGPKSTEELQGAVASAFPVTSATPNSKPTPAPLVDYKGTFTDRKSVV